jgi:tRNA pseudouridine55 synthase
MALIGILSVNKPAGITSRDVVNHIERLVRPAKAGHAGTLDPLATGVLVICVGQATRLIQYLQRLPKRYRATFLLGRRSDTDDIEGQVALIENAPHPSQEMVERVLSQFVGDIQQRPPTHSAIKISGRRAYSLARRGADFELPARTVKVHGIKVIHYEYPELNTEIECGSGTYVRSLGRDLGAALGTEAIMSALERTAIGAFRVAQAVALAEISSESLRKNLQLPLAAVADLPRIELTNGQIVEIGYGRPIPKPLGDGLVPNAAKTSEWAAIDEKGQLVAVLREKQPGKLWPAVNLV